MIIIENLSAGYGKTPVLKNLSLTLEDGMVHGLVGLNGSGKSTFLLCLCGLLKPFSGQLTINGNLISRKDVSLLETEPYFYHGITGKEYLTLFRSKKESKFNADEWQDLLNLPLDILIDGYSTGMKKKLAILGVLKTNNDVILLDEPFNGLDLESSRILISVIKKLRTLNKTIIITSHVLETLTNVCDRIHYLKGGVINKTFDSMNAGQIDKAIFQELDEDVARRIDLLL